jgi:hypothetical protein
MQNIPVIFDEVFTGLYRLGALSAAQILRETPDIACYAKLLTAGAVPMAATLSTAGVFKAFSGPTKVTQSSCSYLNVLLLNCMKALVPRSSHFTTLYGCLAPGTPPWTLLFGISYRLCSSPGFLGCSYKPHAESQSVCPSLWRS